MGILALSSAKKRTTNAPDNNIPDMLSTIWPSVRRRTRLSSTIFHACYVVTSSILVVLRVVIQTVPRQLEFRNPVDRWASNREERRQACPYREVEGFQSLYESRN